VDRHAEPGEEATGTVELMSMRGRPGPKRCRRQEGEALSKWTGGARKSCRHARLNPPRGRQGKGTQGRRASTLAGS